jgi:uncharacterized protein (DUF111 family)
MRVRSVGYGIGPKDFPAANCVRARLGETGGGETQIRFELSANVDDMTAEEIGYAMERLFEAGAAEVYTVPIGMKKSRPGTLIRAICTAEKKEAVIKAYFTHTTTIGVRETETRRTVLSRTEETRDTAYGPLRRKRSEGLGTVRIKFEYEDLARIARENGLSLAEARALAEKEFEQHA